MNEQHVVLPGNTRPAKSDARRLRNADPQSPVEVTLTLRGPALPGPDHLPSQALSREELAAQYGARSEDADEVARVLERYGLKVEETSLPTRSMGSVAR